EKPGERRANGGRAVWKAVRQPQSRTPLRRADQHAAAIAAHAKIESQGIARLNRILNVQRQERRCGRVVKDEWRRSRMCQRRVAEPRCASLAPVRDMKGEVLAQVQPRGLGAGLQHMSAEMVSHAGE